MFNFFKCKPSGPLRYVGTGVLNFRTIEFRPIGREDYVTITTRGVDHLSRVQYKGCWPNMAHRPYDVSALNNISEFKTRDGKVYPKTAVEHIQLTGEVEERAAFKVYFQLYKGEESAVIVGRWSHNKWSGEYTIDPDVTKITSRRAYNIDVIKHKFGIKD